MTLYELLANKSIYKGGPHELIEAHLTQRPANLTKLNPKRPYVLNQIIMKLLAKLSEDRYQSSYTIKKDLETCLQMLEAGEIKTFPIGISDVPEQFILSQKFYDREAFLNKIYSLTGQSGQMDRHLLFITGKVVLGKTSLVHEIKKRITLLGGFICEGKFEAVQHNSPYSAWIMIADHIIEKI